ncbi:hypothetical protein CAEBREN_12472 [Caenorhabditis brenneri]|uniref:Sdz-33 F-box domain-containing protein n=1 Tax=Caenorhabditis brenneri TaxID=135651 RepID=G0N071_CAEBE|nr:hypothetical protein CAEBREN_12472 [Caenorhabditis brenneri]
MNTFKIADFSDAIQPKNKMATEKEIEELLIFIGGFEKWPVLIEDCRREVVKYLDYESRFNLGISSKDDYETVEKTKICVESVEIVDNVRLRCQISQREFDNVSVRIYFPTGSPIEWIISQVGQDTRVQWLHYIPNRDRSVVKEVIWKSCNYYGEAVKFAEKWMKKSNFELETIIVVMAKYPIATSQIKLLPCCKKVIISADDLDSFEWWLKKCPKQLDRLQLNLYSNEEESFTLPSHFLDAPQIMQASRIFFVCRAALSDEQFLKLKSKSIEFESVDVTDRGINKFIRNWVYGTGVPGFKDADLSVTTVLDPEVMVAGLDYVEWDDAFKEEQEVIWKSCDYYEAAVKFTEKWMKKCNFELEAITVAMAKYPFSTSQIKFLPCCKKVSISADDVDSFEWWLEKVPEQLDLLRLADHSGKFELFTLPPNLLNSPQVMQASELDLFCRAVLSNEQFVKLNAKSICLISADVTDEGINQFINNWVNGKGVDGFKTFKLCAIGDRDSEVMVEGLDYVEWDETFENEQNRKSLTFPSGSLNAPQIIQSSKIDFWCRAAFSDEQLLKLNAKSMSFDCVDVTDIGINQFIKNWVNGKGVNDFEKLQLRATGLRDSEVMVAGLGAEEWDQAFGNEHKRFVEDFKSYSGHGRFYQIKSNIDKLSEFSRNFQKLLEIPETSKHLIILAGIQIIKILAGIQDFKLFGGNSI